MEDEADTAMRERKQRRLEKNRESARECRRRKKAHIEGLERSMAGLEAENLRLKLQLKIGEEAEDQEEEVANSLKDRLDELISQGATEGQISQTMLELKEKFADYGKDRTSATVYHLDELQRLLMPTATTHCTLAAILENASRAAVAVTEAGAGHAEGQAGPGSVAVVKAEAVGGGGQGSAEGGIVAHATMGSGGVRVKGEEAGGGRGGGKIGSLWDAVATELGVTLEQQMKLKERSDVVMELCSDLRELMDLVTQLRDRVTHRSEGLDEELSQIQRILTPTQSAKFVLWVSKNQACMHMLNKLWEYTYEEKKSKHGDEDDEGEEEQEEEASGGQVKGV